MRIRIFLLIAFFILLFSNLFAEVQLDDNFPYRIYVGVDKTTDWVDVCSVGYLFNGEYRILFEDKSPIKEIYLDKNMLGEQFYWIVKEKSIWKFFDEGIESRLQLIEPIIAKETNPVLIYKRD